MPLRAFNRNFFRHLLVAAYFLIGTAANALEEPPGAQSEEEAEKYLNKLKQELAEGQIHLDEGVEKSWLNAPVFLPGNIFQQKISKVSLATKHPVVVYLHGCGGIARNHDLRWGRFLSDLGLVTVLPDSMARPNRVPNCDWKSFETTNRFPMALPYREQEISFALQELKKLPWVDTSNIFLMGHSEGANAISRTNIKGFKGFILSSGFCANGISFLHLQTPALIMNFSEDPWHKGVKSRCQAGQSEKMLSFLYLPGKEHETFDNDRAKAEVSRFIKGLLNADIPLK